MKLRNMILPILLFLSLMLFGCAYEGSYGGGFYSPPYEFYGGFGYSPFYYGYYGGEEEHWHHEFHEQYREFSRGEPEGHHEFHGFDRGERGEHHEFHE